MYETASMSLADTEPKLHKIPNADIAFPGAEPDLLRAVLKLNAYCTQTIEESEVVSTNE